MSALDLSPRARRRPAPRIPSALFGTALLVFAELMFFLGLISAYMVLRNRAAVWPPVGQPRLPVEVTAVTTVVLLASGYTIWRVRGAIARDDRQLVRQWLLATLVLGCAFLAVQGYEWVRLIGFGLTTQDNIYGSLFYTVIGAHGLHVAGGIIALGLVLRDARRDRYTPDDHGGLLAMRLFWFFVVGIWPFLYVMVYLW